LAVVKEKSNWLNRDEVYDLALAREIADKP